MMTHEETKVLTYLRTHLMAPIDEIARACFPGVSHEQAARILWQLEWLGYIVRYGQEVVQITSRGTSVP